MLRCTAGALVILSSLLFVAGCSDDSESGLRVANVAEIDVDPPNFLFPILEVGQTEDRIVVISNLKEDSKLAIKDITGNFSPDNFVLYWRDADDVDHVGIDSDGDYFEYPIVLESDDTLTLVLAYAPTEVGVDHSGQIVLDTNLPGQDGQYEIPIQTGEGGADIDVSPPSLDFGRVPAGEPVSADITVTNLGAGTLRVDRLLLNGSADFTIAVSGTDPQEDPAALADPDQDGEAGLAASGGSFVVSVTYRPEVEGPDSGELSIFTNDPQSPEIRVPIIANGATPCIRIHPEEITFPATVLLGSSDSVPVTIQSCGGEVLEVSAIELSEDSDEGFTLADLPPEFPAFVPAAAEDAPPPESSFNVVFTPVAEEPAAGTLLVKSNDPTKPSLEIPINARGLANACPEPSIENDTFEVLPLDVVSLDGSTSVDEDGPNGKPVKYIWTVTQRPDGSSFVPVERIRDLQRPADDSEADDPSTPTAVFFVELAGDYTIDLHVVDNLDLVAPSEPNCPEPIAEVHIHAEPNEDIHIELVWRTPGDDDETDLEGSDVDLHFLHPTGRGWQQSPGDCYYANPKPDWGNLNDPSDDPSLDIDDTNGSGPENINLDNPQDTGELGNNYSVGVHYYRREDFISGFDWGSSWVTVRIFIRGLLAWDYSDGSNPGEKELRERNHFWEAASIVWTANDKRVIPIDRYQTSVP